MSLVTSTHVGNKEEYFLYDLNWAIFSHPPSLIDLIYVKICKNIFITVASFESRSGPLLDNG
jgi:hypothetical protein